MSQQGASIGDKGSSVIVLDATARSVYLSGKPQQIDDVRSGVEPTPLK